MNSTKKTYKLSNSLKTPKKENKEYVINTTINLEVLKNIIKLKQLI